MTTVEILLRVGAGVGLGALIGFERQYRARMAGLRTNALVSVGSTLFVLLSAHGFSSVTDAGSADPTRVAAQIVSGIGFLGAGVILRDGLSVRGLNTAATLWCSAAIGALSGAGLYQVAAIGTVVVIAVNVALRAVGRAVDRRPDTGDEEPTTYAFLAVTRDDAEAHVRALLVQALTRTDFRLLSVASGNRADGLVEVRAELAGDQRDDKQMESAVSRLSLEPSVTSVRWQVAVPDGPVRPGPKFV
ncbi:putative Mg2+ transporter-C (MgtC) family protein [Herbihabitans rhizosphaerae]|uniref:Putative Mg2+ transporter-C (MgtC) family protein n=1 Tax=Herbihabitans rhizosphaerae TaxID=1872711 RepID=A0A4V2ES56_9PSEU|nr:MgtC/SapB family protein [Herbihabitans rhizosphaerae]RZS36403.1 putative Mg2+ transporter-C (MgtC) family protein [Herbihabitans rhizosphaerae]